MLKTEEDIIELIHRDEYMMGILRTVNQLGLDDYWVCAGFVRNKVWDVIFNCKTRTPYNDIDVVYFDSEDISKEADKLIEKSLVEIRPEIPFEVVNQARMFFENRYVKIRNAADGIQNFPETSTAIGVRIRNNQLILAAPHGVKDLLNGVVRPTPLFEKEAYRNIYYSRLNDKKWLDIWPGLIMKR